MKKLPLISCVVLSAIAMAVLLRDDARTTASTATAKKNPKSDLRSRVEQLKRDVVRTPTDEATGKDRASILWEWSNAVALRGGEIPVELPLVCGLILSDWPSPGGVRAQYARIDRFVHELTYREEHPDAIGKLTSNTTGPFPAASYQTIKQTYTVGRMPMLPGGGVLVAKHFMADHAAFQASNPKGDNYVSIRSSNAKAEFVLSTTPLSGMHGGFATAADVLTFQLKGPTLMPGETFTVTQGDRSQGSRGFRVQSYSNDRFPLPLYIDLEAKKNFFTLPIIGYRVVGKDAVGVHAFAPSVARAGEPFEVSVRSQDEYYNRASGPIPAYEVSVNGRVVSQIDAGDDAITVLGDIKLNEPGVYRFSVRSADGRIIGSSNPVWVQENPTSRIYWGETHGHSGFAEGQGTADAYFEFGRDDARLDFLTHSEHDLWMDDREWDTLVHNAAKYNEEGRFITFLGYEWTMRAENGGHHNVLFRTPQNRQRVPIHEAGTLSALYRQLANENDMDDVLVIPHAHEPGEYRQSHPQMETLVEIMSMHGRFEWFGVMYLNHGHQVGFIAGSDDHLSHPGYPTPLLGGLADSGGLAAVIAPEKTSDAIFDAMKDLSAYATTGDRIILDVQLNGARMGKRIPYTTERKIKGSVFGTAPIESITLVKNGRELWTRDCLKTDATRFVEVRFSSPSDPVVRDSPRAWRQWEGSVQVRGATLVGITSPSFYNPRSEHARIDDLAAGKVSFAAITRGSDKSIVLELDGAGPDTAIDVSLIANKERYTTPSQIRSPAALPAEAFTHSMEDIVAGTAVHEMQVERFTDTVTARLIDPRGKLDQAFEYTDNDSPEPGDYYYVRIKQLNGQMAWSSPIWVGGYAAK